MNKIKCAFLLLLLLFILSGCKDKNVIEEKDEKYISGYVMEKENNNILVGSASGNYRFNIENAKIETEDDIALDDMCDIYYHGELNDKDVNDCIKVVEFYSNYIVGEVTNIDVEKESMSVITDNITYNFNLSQIADEVVKNIKELQTYEIKFDKKLTSVGMNNATEINRLEVDETPKEELELVDTIS